MKIFLGSDICEIERIKETYDRFGERFLQKTFTESESMYCLANSKLIAQRLAVRFAAKEAVSKALGVGINKIGWNRGINWKDVEIVRTLNGAITVKLSGKAKQFESELGINEWTVSVSHSKKDAIATVIGYKK